MSKVGTYSDHCNGAWYDFTSSMHSSYTGLEMWQCSNGLGGAAAALNAQNGDLCEIFVGGSSKGMYRYLTPPKAPLPPGTWCVISGSVLRVAGTNIAGASPNMGVHQSTPTIRIDRYA